MSFKASLPKLLVPGIALVAILGSAAAAIVLTYTNASSVQATASTVPVQFEAGADSGASTYVPSFSLSTNRTTFSASLKGVPEATVTIDDLVHVKNADTAAHTVTLSTTQVTNAFVTAYSFEFFDGATSVGTLNLKSASPSVTFTNLAAGTTLTAKVTLTLASGAGANNVAETRAVAMTVSA